MFNLTSPVPGNSGEIYELSDVSLVALTELTEPDLNISLRLSPGLSQAHTGVPPGLRSFSSQGVHILLREGSGVRVSVGVLGYQVEQSVGVAGNSGQRVVFLVPSSAPWQPQYLGQAQPAEVLVLPDDPRVLSGVTVSCSTNTPVITNTNLSLTEGLQVEGPEHRV